MTEIVRVRTRDQAAALVGLIVGLARYEKLEPPSSEAQRRMVEDALRPHPPFEALLAMHDGRAVGYAVYFFTYSTFLGLPSLYLEDIFIEPEHRRRRAGEELFRECARIALERGCGRMEWQVLGWNEPAHRFYAKLGAKRLEGWEPYRLVAEELARLA